MRHGDSLRIALLKLRRRWGRALFAVVALAIALVPPILVLDLYDGAAAVITSSVSARGLDPRSLLVMRELHSFRTHMPLTLADQELIRSLPDLVDQQVPLRIPRAFIRLGENEIIEYIRSDKHEFVRHLLPAGQPFETLDGVVPVLLGKLSLLYRYNDQYDIERVDRDPNSLIGQTLELHTGDILQDLRGLVSIRDKQKGRYRPATEAEWRARAERIRARVGVEFDLEEYDQSLITTARVVGVRPGHGVTVPHEAAERMQNWLNERDDRARTLAALTERGREESRELLFATDSAAIAAAESLKASGLTVRSYHEATRKWFDQIRFAIYIVGGVVVVILLLACFMVSSVLLRVILDSTREIGLLRALGARQSHVLRIYMYEAALLCGLGSLLGMIIGNVAAAVISSQVLATAARETSSFEIMGIWVQLFQIDLLPASLWRFASAQLLWIGFAVSLALVSAWVPARRSARMDPIRALARE